MNPADVEPAPFKFRLARVRDLRAKAEEEARLRLAGAVGEVRDAEAELRAAEGRASAAREQQAAARLAPLTGTDLLTLQAWQHRTDLAKVDAGAELRRREHVATRRRAEAVDASRDRQVLDRLHDRRRADHAVAAERVRAAGLDELAQAMHLRRTA